MLFRQMLAKNVLSQLSRSKAYRLILVIAILFWSIAIVGIGAWTYLEALRIETNGTAQKKNNADEKIVENFVIALGEARRKGVVSGKSPIPADLNLLRARFEHWWRDASLADKKAYKNEVVFNALSWNGRLYRLYDLNDEEKVTAIYWIDQSVQYFNEIQDPYFLVESLLDKAAIFLELSQIQHTEPESWRKIAEDGDKVMARAATLADEIQKPNLYRIWSRFLYNLARPRDGLLSKTWNNNWLSQAYEKSKKAVSLAPNDLKNSTQFARSVQKYSANSPQDKQEIWIDKIWAAQKAHHKAVKANDKSLKTPHKRIPPLNILAVITLDAVGRELDQRLPNDERLRVLETELLNVAIPAQQEALALVGHTEWKEDYDFDLNYDLGRMQLLAVQIQDYLNNPNADGLFGEAIANLSTSRAKATAKQVKAVKIEIQKSAIFTKLSSTRRKHIKEIF